MDTPELLRLMLVALVLWPYIYVVRRLRPAPGMRFLHASFFVLCSSYLLNVLEDLVMKDLMVTLLLVSFGVAGVLALTGVLLMRRDARSERSEP